MLPLAGSGIGLWRGLLCFSGPAEKLDYEFEDICPHSRPNKNRIGNYVDSSCHGQRCVPNMESSSFFLPVNDSSILHLILVRGSQRTITSSSAWTSWSAYWLAFILTILQKRLEVWCHFLCKGLFWRLSLMGLNHRTGIPLLSKGDFSIISVILVSVRIL